MFQLGFTATISKLITGINGTEYFAASWIAFFIIEKVGRRKLMLFGAVGQALCMAVLAISGSFGNKAAGWVSVVFLFLFNTVFAIGWLGMTWRKFLEVCIGAPDVY